MGRGAATETSTPIRRRTPAQAANAVNPAIPERIEVARRGRASLTFDNPHLLDDSQFDLVYRLHHAIAAAEGSAVSAKDVASLGGPSDSHAVSAELRRLASDIGLVKIEREGRSLTYGLEASLDEIFPFDEVTTDRMHDAKHRDDTLRVVGMRHRDNVTVSNMNGYFEGRIPLVSRQSFASVGRSVAARVIEGEPAFGVVDASAGGYGPDDHSVLVLTPYRFAKGRRQEPFVAIKNLPVGKNSGNSFSWSGSSFEATSFNDHVLRAEDLRDLCTLLADPHKVAAPAGL